ncbi:MAG: PLP-dependent aminotransferase family protein, partial [Arcobacteraceae bacterium]
MKRSFIREILEHTTNKTISFAGGLPDESLFPNEKIAQSAARVLKNKNALQYTKSTGIDSLKEKIAAMYTNEGFETTPNNIMITSGSQQALDIIARYNSKKDITVEAPSYLGAMNIFNLNQLNQKAVLLEDDGICIEKFEESFNQTKFSYIIPDFQNPTGKSYSQTKRDQIVQIVQKYDGILIEDAPYSELYYETKNKMISKELPNNSFHLGTFSKTLAPSLRIGWIRADESLLNPLIPYKEAMDLHTNGLSQYILNDYLNNIDDFYTHLDSLRASYKNKMLLFKKYLDIYLPQFEYVEPKGGMFIYGKLPNLNTALLVQECLKNDVVFVPGIEFYNDASIT